MFELAGDAWSEGNVNTHNKNNRDDVHAAPNLYTGEPPLVSARSTWNKVQKDLSYALGANIHRSWTARLSITNADEHEVVLCAETRFIASKVRTDYLDNVKRLWVKHDEVAPPRQVKLAGPISKTDASISHASIVQPQPIQRDISSREPIRPSSPRLRQIADGSNLNSAATKPTLRSGELFRFDNFIVGSANQFAYSALHQVCNSTLAGSPVQYLSLIHI